MDWQARGGPFFQARPSDASAVTRRKDLTDWARESLQEILLDALKAPSVGKIRSPLGQSESESGRVRAV